MPWPLPSLGPDVITPDLLRRAVEQHRGGHRDPQGYVLMCVPGSITPEAEALAPELGVEVSFYPEAK